MSAHGQLDLIKPPAENLKWWQKPLACEDCKRVTSRPAHSSQPCAWCSGRLAEVIRA